jgi:hypothetical protein
MSNYLTRRHAGIWNGMPFDSGRARSTPSYLAFDLSSGEVPNEGGFVATPGAVRAPVGKMFSAPLAVGCDCTPKSTGDFAVIHDLPAPVAIGIAAVLGAGGGLFIAGGPVGSAKRKRYMLFGAIAGLVGGVYLRSRGK